MATPRVQLKRIVKIINGGTPTPAEENWNGEIPWATPVDLNNVDGGFIGTTLRNLSEIGVRTGSVLVPEDSVILSTRAPIGYTAVATNQISFNQGCKALVPLRPAETDSRYLRYAIQASVENLEALGKGSTFLELSTSDLASFRIPWPKYQAQKRIADELDRELAEIDEFIADQLRLQDLLQERLVSLTFELATDASNPDRYETGHPFWKTLPKGWTLQKLGWHFKIGNGSTPSTENPDYWTDKDTGFPWFNSSIVNSDLAADPARYVTDTAIRECHLPVVPKESLLVGLTGQGKTRGMVTKTGIESTINQHMAFLIPKRNSPLDVDFTLLVLKASYPELRFLSDGNGGTKGALTCDELKNFQIPTPQTRKKQKLLSRTYSAHFLKLYNLKKEVDSVIPILIEKSNAAKMINLQNYIPIGI